MRLSMEEVQKQHESTKKLYEQGLTVAPVDVKRVLDLYDTIEALQQENERLADETIKLMKENAKNSNKKDELVKVLKQARDAIKFSEALQNIDALIGGEKRLVDGEWKHYCPECVEVKEPRYLLAGGSCER